MVVEKLHKYVYVTLWFSDHLSTQNLDTIIWIWNNKSVYPMSFITFYQRDYVVLGNQR